MNNDITIHIDESEKLSAVCSDDPTQNGYAFIGLRIPAYTSGVTFMGKVPTLRQMHKLIGEALDAIDVKLAAAIVPYEETDPKLDVSWPETVTAEQHEARMKRMEARNV